MKHYSTFSIEKWRETN